MPDENGNITIEDTHGKACTYCYGESFEVEDNAVYCTDCGKIIETEDDLTEPLNEDE